MIGLEYMIYTVFMLTSSDSLQITFLQQPTFLSLKRYNYIIQNRFNLAQTLYQTNKLNRIERYVNYSHDQHVLQQQNSMRHHLRLIVSTIS